MYERKSTVQNALVSSQQLLREDKDAVLVAVQIGGKTEQWVGSCISTASS